MHGRRVRVGGQPTGLAAVPATYGVELTWKASTDDVGVAYYLVTVGTQTRQPKETRAFVGQLAASTDYTFYSGYVALAYWWARSVAAANASAHAQSFRQSKLETARFYYARILPRTLAHAAAIESGAAPLMAMDAERFGP